MFDMKWDYFIWFALAAVIFWVISSIFAFKSEHYKKSIIASLLGSAIFATFIVGMWIALERPPMRTLGETRLWYSLMLPLVGLITYAWWKFKWVLSATTLMSLIFIFINVLRPEIHNKSLMPALQSPWFVPHVIVYMIGYAILGAAALYAFYYLVKKEKAGNSATIMVACDNLVYAGTAFIAIGLLFGAIWAKAAWGHYWSWDPKETWSAATWLAYLVYIHYRLQRPKNIKVALYLLLFGFLMLMVTWFGVNYLPSAQGASMHIYG
jgi:ABC-type transport system involved in cytochrome c biogenesis permease subunit